MQSANLANLHNIPAANADCAMRHIITQATLGCAGVLMWRHNANTLEPSSNRKVLNSLGLIDLLDSLTSSMLMSKTHQCINDFRSQPIYLNLPNLHWSLFFGSISSAVRVHASRVQYCLQQDCKSPLGLHSLTDEARWLLTGCLSG